MGFLELKSELRLELRMKCGDTYYNASVISNNSVSARILDCKANRGTHEANTSMITKTENINITPDKSIYPKLGQAGYSVAEAISELVDNSIDARYEDAPVTIKIIVDGKKSKITIKDDGVGMTKDEAARSIVLGYSVKKNKLGHFGLGMKTACQSLGEVFEIASTKTGSDEEYIIEFDESEWIRSGNWHEFPLKIQRGVDKDHSGTRITIENLRISTYPNLVTNLKKQLAERFAPFILNGEANIRVNTGWVHPEPSKLVANTRKDFTIKLNSSDEIRGWTAILEIGSQRESGLNLYRLGRLIRAHEKLGYEYHPSKMSVIGEIHMDCIPVTHNKREFITASPEFEEFMEKFKKILEPILKEAQQRHRELKIRDLSPEKKETLKDNLLKALNRVDDLQELAFPGGDPIKRSDEDGDEFDQERRQPPKTDVAEIEIIEEPSKPKKRRPKKTKPKKARFLTVAGKRYQFDWDWKDLDEEMPKYAELDRENNRIMVYLNTRFPALTITKDEVFYIATFVAEGIAEVFCLENNQAVERVKSIRDATLYQLAKVVSEDIQEE